MGERIFDKPSVDRSQFPKTLMYLDSEGYICKADLGGGELSPEQLAERKKKWDAIAVQNKENIGKRKALRVQVCDLKKQIGKLAMCGDNVTGMQTQLSQLTMQLDTIPRAKAIPQRYK